MHVNPYSPPQADLDGVKPDTGVDVALWNPNAAALWSLLLTPIFGAMLQSKNWEAMGRPEEAQVSRYWAIGCAGTFAILILAELVFPASAFLGGIGRSAGIAMLVGWYMSAGKVQIEHVKNNYGKDYPRRGWGKPFLTTFLVLMGLFISMMVLSLIFDLVPD